LSCEFSNRGPAIAAYIVNLRLPAYIQAMTDSDNLRSEFDGMRSDIAKLKYDLTVRGVLAAAAIVVILASLEIFG